MTDIKVKLIDYKDAKILEGLDDYIILHKNHLEYKWKCAVELVSEDGKHRADYHGVRDIRKEFIAGVEAYWSSAHERYICDLVAEQSPVWMFTTFKEATALREKILEWLTND